MFHLICRVIHADYGMNREMEFKHTKQLFGPYNNDLYWSSTKGALIKEEMQINKNQPKVNAHMNIHIVVFSILRKVSNTLSF